MSTWKELLREHDPAAGPSLSAEIVAAMRRRVVNAVPAARSGQAWWLQPLAVAAMVLLMIAAGIVAGRRLPVIDRDAMSDIPVLADVGERRQLQFATPGGTRIIWVFDSQFTINGTTP